MIRFSDVYVRTLARGLCEGSEQFVSASSGTFQSFWTFRIPLFRHDYLFLATSERLFVIDHRKGFVLDRMDKIESYRWSDIASIKVSGVFTKRLVIRDASNRILVKAVLPKLLAKMFGIPIANQDMGIQGLVTTWEQRRQLAAPAAFAQLPPGSMQPAMPYAPQPQAMPQAPSMHPQPSYAPPPPPQLAAPPSYAVQHAAPPSAAPPSYGPPPTARPMQRTPPPPPPQRSQTPLPPPFPPQAYARPNGTTYSRPS